MADEVGSSEVSLDEWQQSILEIVVQVTVHVARTTSICTSRGIAACVPRLCGVRYDDQTDVVGGDTIRCRCALHRIQACDDVGMAVDGLLVTWLQTILFKVLVCNGLLQLVDVEVRQSGVARQGIELRVQVVVRGQRIELLTLGGGHARVDAGELCGGEVGIIQPILENPRRAVVLIAVVVVVAVRVGHLYPCVVVVVVARGGLQLCQRVVGSTERSGIFLHLAAHILLGGVCLERGVDGGGDHRRHLCRGRISGQRIIEGSGDGSVGLSLVIVI